MRVSGGSRQMSERGKGCRYGRMGLSMRVGGGTTKRMEGGD
jgi:hypothetical protein